MLKNISVSTKGFAAFAILAFIAIVASGFIYTRAVTVNTLVKYNQIMSEELEASNKLFDYVNQANFALKNFLLTGNREFVTTYETLSEQIDTQVALLETLYSTHSPQDLPLLLEANAAIAEWRTTIADRQISLMRDPMTVELARALELIPSLNDQNP